MNKLLTRITTHHAILPRQAAHSRRSKDIYTAIACLLGLIALLACSCSPKNGCPAVRNMSGYTWVKWTEKGKSEGRVTVMEMKEGKIICSFTETAK